MAVSGANSRPLMKVSIGRRRFGVVKWQSSSRDERDLLMYNYNSCGLEDLWANKIVMDGIILILDRNTGILDIR